MRVTGKVFHCFQIGVFIGYIARDIKPLIVIIEIYAQLCKFSGLQISLVRGDVVGPFLHVHIYFAVHQRLVCNGGRAGHLCPRIAEHFFSNQPGNSVVQAYGIPAYIHKNNLAAPFLRCLGASRGKHCHAQHSGQYDT